jgi:dihydroneopterin aldolase
MLVYNKDISMKGNNRKILINNLIIHASVGVYEHEKQNKQKIIVNVELLLSNDSEPKYDNLEATQDYSQFRKCLIDIIQSQHFHLLEVLVEKIHSNLMINSYILGAKVKISKPDIFNDCEVAYELSNI